MRLQFAVALEKKLLIVRWESLFGKENVIFRICIHKPFDAEIFL